MYLCKLAEQWGNAPGRKQTNKLKSTGCLLYCPLRLIGCFVLVISHWGKKGVIVSVVEATFTRNWGTHTTTYFPLVEPLFPLVDSIIPCLSTWLCIPSLSSVLWLAHRPPGLSNTKTAPWTCRFTSQGLTQLQGKPWYVSTHGQLGTGCSWLTCPPLAPHGD